MAAIADWMLKGIFMSASHFSLRLGSSMLIHALMPFKNTFSMRFILSASISFASCNWSMCGSRRTLSCSSVHPISSRTCSTCACDAYLLPSLSSTTKSGVVSTIDSREASAKEQVSIRADLNRIYPMRFGTNHNTSLSWTTKRTRLAQTTFSTFSSSRTLVACVAEQARDILCVTIVWAREILIWERGKLTQVHTQRISNLYQKWQLFLNVSNMQSNVSQIWFCTIYVAAYLIRV